MFWTRQVVFSVTRNIFRNAKQLARKGVENSSEVVVFYRAPRVPRPVFKRSTGPRHFHSKLAPQSLVFAHYRTQKRGKSCKDLPRKRLDSIQFFANKMPDLQFSFGSSERFLMIRLHKIRGNNTCLPAHKKEVSTTYFRSPTTQFPPSTRQRRPPKTARLRTKKGPVPNFETGPIYSNEAASTRSSPPRAA